MPPVKPSPAMQAAAAAFSTTIKKREDAFYEPRKQDYYRVSSDGNWVPASSGDALAKDELQPSLHSREIRLISWNIDVLVPFAEERMSAALDHLHDLVSWTRPESAIIIFFQEMGVSDMEQIRDSAWVKQRFNLTEIDSRNWLGPHYGTTTLVDRRLHIDSVFRVPWYSKFDRDGLFVDISLYNQKDSNAPPKVMRLCNTHLESLVADPPVRPIQMAAAKQYFNQRNISCAVLAGDLNAIQPFDRTLHAENVLRDAYLQIGGQEDTPGEEDSHDGYTWGYQSPQVLKDRFGCSRMDKILYGGFIKPIKFQRIGMGVKVAEEHRQMMKDAGELDWVSDHYGVMCDFVIFSDGQLVE